MSVVGLRNFSAVELAGHVFAPANTRNRKPFRHKRRTGAHGAQLCDCAHVGTYLFGPVDRLPGYGQNLQPGRRCRSTQRRILSEAAPLATHFGITKDSTTDLLPYSASMYKCADQISDGSR